MPAENRFNFIVGGAIVFFSLVGLINNLFFIVRAEKATATVVSAKDVSRSRHGSWDVTIEFRDDTGEIRRHVLQSETLAETPNTPGALVDIYFLPEAPGRVRRNSTAANWGIYSGIGAVGALLLFGAYLTKPRR